MDLAWRPTDVPDLTGINAVVTGAGREVGRLIIEHLTSHGANVFAVSRDELPPDRFDENVEPVRMNPTSMASIQRGAERIREHVGRIDLLVHAATISVAPRFRSAEGHDLMLATNYLGFVMLSQELAPAMRNSDAPRIVLAGPGDPLDVPINLEGLDADADVPWDVLYHQSRIAAMMFALELNCRAERSFPAMISAVAESAERVPSVNRHHPVRRHTRALLSRFNTWLNDAPAAPTLYASTSLDARGGTYYAPAGRGRLQAQPISERMPDSACGEGVRAELWQRTEDLLGIQLNIA